MTTFCIIHPGPDGETVYTNAQGIDAADALERFIGNAIADAGLEAMEGEWAVCVEPSPESEATR